MPEVRDGELEESIMKISLLIPTRGRPAEFSRCIDSFRKNTRQYNLEVVALTDSRDSTLPEYNKDLIDIEVDERLSKAGTVQMWNTLAEKATGDYLMMINDDNIMETDGWDSIFLNSSPFDDIFVAWPNGQQGQCVNPLISRRLYNILGWFVPRCFNWWYADTALHALGTLVGRTCYMPNVLCRSTIHKEITKDQQMADYARFLKWVREERPGLTRKVWGEMV
jgi:glycosyltransferase involved in cell wall biosynthesis